MARLDPVTVEVVENRLIQIAREAGITLSRTAASPVTVEAKDFGFNITDGQARTVVYSIWMPRHGTTLAHLIKASIKKFEGQGIEPGDMIMVNNPYDGALHVPDIAVISPVFYNDQLIAWTGCATHHIDMGGITPGFCPQATDWFQEGLKFPPIKLFERGRLRQDLFDMFLANVRMPSYQGLDLLAQVAANNVSRQKIGEMAAKYGVDVLRECYDAIIDLSERKTQERIASLREGVYEYTDYLDFEGMHKLHCILTIKDGHLTFDFNGSAPQASSFINCAYACTEANVHNILVCQLIPDVPANEGCFRHVTVTVPEGSIFNCRPPAPCSGATILTGFKAQSVAMGVLARALQDSPDWWRINAGWGWGSCLLQISGLSREKKYYTYPLMDMVMLGGGARATKDGLHAQNIAGSSNTSLPNVETIEQRYPVLYLERGLIPDSEGAGKLRGGLGGRFAVKAHQTDQIDVVAFMIGKEHTADGFAGGLPGGPSLVTLCTDSDVEAKMQARAVAFAEVEGNFRILPSRDRFLLRPTDVVSVQCQGGGGYGHPLERDPLMVREDVLDGYVSLARAREVYGVVLDDQGQIDWEQTSALRQRLAG